MTAAIDDIAAIRRRVHQLRGIASGVCLAGTGKGAAQCWCYAMGSPPFPCPPKEIPCPADEPLKPTHELGALMPVPWFIGGFDCA
jgi:hypothetical protein